MTSSENTGTPTGTTRRATSRRAAAVRTAGLALLSAIIAAAAPTGLTGRPVVDAVERFLLAAAFTWVVAHGRRATSFVAASALLLVARDDALLLLVAALVAGILNLRLDRRMKELGAVTAGGIVNAVLRPTILGPRSIVLPLLVIGGVIVFAAAARQMRRRHRRRIMVTAIVTSALIMAAVVMVGIAAVRAADPVRSGARDARLALEAVRDGDSSRAARHLDDARRELIVGERALSTLARPGRAVPGVSQQVHAIETAVSEARALTELADDLLSTDYADLRYEGGFVLDPLVDLIPAAERVESALDAADVRLADVRAGPLLPGLRTPIEEFHDTVRRARVDTGRAVQILPELPGLLGGEGERRYLVVFITPAELRGAGGFIGSWAELGFVDGRAVVNESGRVRDLIDYGGDSGRILGGPDDYRRRYGRFRPQDLVQDATMSPNWPSNARALASIYPQAGGSEVDGVIGVTPAGLAALLEFTGPVAVDGVDEAITAESAVDFLLRDQYELFGERAAREDVLADASTSIFEALVGASLPSPRRIGDVLGPVVRGRHIQVWMANPSEQDLLVSLEADGSLVFPPGATGWQLVQQNAGNNKIDAHLHREIDYDVDVDPDRGTFEGSMRVTLHNRPPSLDLPTAVVGNQRGRPLGTNLASLSVHGPFRVTSAEIGGRPIVLGRSGEAGVPVWDTPLVEIPPGGSVEVLLEVEGEFDPGTGFRLRVLPQPLAHPDEVRITVRAASGRLGPPTVDEERTTISGDEGERRIVTTLDEPLEVVLPFST